MNVIRITCQHKEHGSLGMPDREANAEMLDCWLDDLRARGCFPLVESYSLDELTNDKRRG